MNRRREESAANPLPAYNPSWEEMEEVLVSVVVDGWEMYVKESRPKGQRLPNEVDPEKVAISHDGVPQSGASSSNEAAQQMVDAATTDLPGEPEHFQPHEVEEPEVDAEIIDAMLKPYADKLPMVSDERDIDEDLDEEIVFREPIVGGPASLLARRKAKPSANKIHAVEFKLDGSGVVNVLTSDVTRDPAKLELKLESTTEGTSGPIIMRRYDLNDDEMQNRSENFTLKSSHRKPVFERVTPSPQLRSCRRRRLSQHHRQSPRARWARCPS